jgi:hypothetical protein
LRHPKTRKPLAKSAIHRGALTASVGFPYGYDAADNSIVSSGFSGHIVGSQIYSRLPGRPLVFVERYEALNLGLAVSARTILSLHLPDGQSLLDFVLATGVEVHNRD